MSYQLILALPCLTGISRYRGKKEATASITPRFTPSIGTSCRFYSNFSKNDLRCTRPYFGFFGQAVFGQKLQAKYNRKMKVFSNSS
mmetsp:Transcript_63093/g.186420  ORF Transcript_63093/g.186420 Transcript_63093/m.186420 type:complete len:86 (+) Transcript_63093:2936-3193(+)